MTSNASNSVITKVALWVTPVLLVIIGYFTKSELEQINKKMDEIVQLKVTDAIMSGKIDALEYRVTELEKTVHSIPISGKLSIPIAKASNILLAKPEEEYSISQYIKEPLTAP